MSGRYPTESMHWPRPDGRSKPRVGITAGSGQFVLVNLRREPLGAPMPPDALTELFAALAHRAKLARAVSPHMARHAFASNVADAGGTLDEVQVLLGQKHPGSAQPYLHPAAARSIALFLLAAVAEIGVSALTEFGYGDDLVVVGRVAVASFLFSRARLPHPRVGSEHSAAFYIGETVRRAEPG